MLGLFRRSGTRRDGRGREEKQPGNGDEQNAGTGRADCSQYSM